MYWNLLSVFANCLWIYFVSNMGHFIIKFWAGTSEKHVCVFSKCLAKLCLSTPKNAKHVGNSDRNETCQCAERMCVLINYMWDDTVLNGLLIGKTIAYRFIAGNVNVAEKMPWKSLKLVRCAFSMRLWMFFLPWTVLKMWSPKHSLFQLRMRTTSVVLPRRIDLCAFVRQKPQRPTGSPEKPPEAWRRCTTRPSPAASRLRSCCSPKALRWMPRTTRARASIRGSRRQTSSLADSGTSEGFSGIETSAFFRKCLAKLWVFRTKKCETCREQWSQWNMPIMCGKRINVVEKMLWNLFAVFVIVLCFL